MIQPTNMQTQYPQQGGANAVSINIYNPQAYAGLPNTNTVTQAPYTYQNSLYQMPTASAYAPFANQGFAPQYVNNLPMMQPQQFVAAAPAPQVMPESVIPAAPQMTNMAQAPQVQQEIAPQVQQEVAPQVQQTPQMDVTPQAVNTPLEIVQPQESAPVIDIDGLIQNLKSNDPNVKADTINQIASYAQEAPEIALQVVSEPIMQSLVNIINEDTSKLAGPNEAQIAVSDKISRGMQLTPEEDAIAEQLSPRDMANKNRIFALYTLAMIQKLQREELNQYIETQKANGQETIEPLKVEDLVGFNDVVNVIKNDRPELQVAAIQALQHVVEPQDKATTQAVLADALKSNEESVKSAANEAMLKFQA